MDLATEENIQEIQDQGEEIIKKINDYEEKTIQNANVNRTDSDVSKPNEIARNFIEEADLKLKQFSNIY